MRSPHRGILSWSFTTLAVAAKTPMSSVPDYLMIETAFTAVQWIVVGPLTVLAFDYGTASARHIRTFANDVSKVAFRPNADLFAASRSASHGPKGDNRMAGSPHVAAGGRTSKSAIDF